MNILLNVLIAVLVFWLVHTYLIPLLPEPVRTVAYVILVVAAIVWLFQFVF